MVKLPSLSVCCVTATRRGVLPGFEGRHVSIPEVDLSPRGVVPRGPSSRALTGLLASALLSAPLEVPRAPHPSCPRSRRDVLEEPTEEELTEKLSHHPHLQLCR